MERSLYVYFQMGGLPPSGSAVLSFLPPADDAIAESWNVSYFSGRRLLSDVRERARQTFIECLRKPFATPYGWTNRSLRKRLQYGDGVSLWWYHPASQKSTVEPGFVYTDTLQLTLIEKVANRIGTTRIILVGGPTVFAHCLAGSFTVSFEEKGDPFEVDEPNSIKDQLLQLYRDLRVRLDMIREAARVVWAVRKAAVSLAQTRDVLLQSYWPWSMTDDGQGDRYFQRLGEVLEGNGLSVGYIATVDLGRPIRDGDLEPLRGKGHIQFIEQFYSYLDLIRFGLDLRGYLVFLFFRRITKIRQLFRQGRVDYWPLHEPALRAGFLSFDMVRSRLREAATIRLLNHARPRAVGTFLEFFIESRPLYGACDVVKEHRPLTFAVQHAIVNEDKVFDFLHGAEEIVGAPDESPCPAPDFVCAMSAFTKRAWSKVGFPDSDLYLTGGLRYEHVRIKQQVPRSGSCKLLLVASMNNHQDLDMTRAVYEATREMPAAEVLFRDHPHFRTSSMPEFAAVADRVRVSNDSLSEDLEWADIVLFAHSTVAEEALVNGKPTWQWIWPGCQASALYDYGKIPQFTSARELRNALVQYNESPGHFFPTPELQREILDEFFGSDPSRAADSVVDVLKTRLEGSSVG